MHTPTCLNQKHEGHTCGYTLHHIYICYTVGVGWTHIQTQAHGNEFLSRNSQIQILPTLLVFLYPCVIAERGFCVGLFLFFCCPKPFCLDASECSVIAVILWL